MINRIKNLEEIQYEKEFLTQRLIPALKVALLKDNPDTLKDITWLMQAMLLFYGSVTAESIVKEQNMTMLIATKIGFTKNNKHAAGVIEVLTMLVGEVPELKAQFVELNVLGRIHKLLKELEAIYPNFLNADYLNLSQKAVEFVAKIMEHCDESLANRLLDQGLLRLVVRNLKMSSDQHLKSANIILRLVNLREELEDKHKQEIEAINLVSLVKKASNINHTRKQELRAKIGSSKIANEMLINLSDNDDLSLPTIINSSSSNNDEWSDAHLEVDNLLLGTDTKLDELMRADPATIEFISGHTPALPNDDNDNDNSNNNNDRATARSTIFQTSSASDDQIESQRQRQQIGVPLAHDSCQLYTGQACLSNGSVQYVYVARGTTQARMESLVVASLAQIKSTDESAAQVCAGAASRLLCRHVFGACNVHLDGTLTTKMAPDADTEKIIGNVRKYSDECIDDTFESFQRKITWYEDQDDLRQDAPLRQALFAVGILSNREVKLPEGCNQSDDGKKPAAKSGRVLLTKSKCRAIESARLNHDTVNALIGAVRDAKLDERNLLLAYPDETERP
ncbi:hypothetical protein GZH46_02337, partial [Fragariocoptes setiger]